MKLIEVTTKELSKKFIEANVELNKGVKNYIRPLDKDINEVFDPARNKAFRFGSVRRWILMDDAGKFAGRIAAFINKRYKNKGDDGPVGGIGFFDCINDQKAANLLFDTAKEWLASQQMEAMDGPINFGERDRWWGLVVEGFQEPLYGMNFNPPYYKELFENYGFQPFYYQICWGLDPKKRLSDKLLERFKVLENNPDFSARYIDKRHLEKYAEDFTIVYNAAWAGHGGMKQLKKEQVIHMFRQMKPVMDERIVWFAYYKDEPIAIYVNLPDLNQWFKYLNGKFDLLHKLKFLWVKRTKPNKKFSGIVFGIVPKFQGKGIDSYIIGETAKVVQRPDIHYTEYEMQWIGDFNPKMMNMVQNIGEAFASRKLITYRYLFDRTKEFKRHPMV